jgi:hypothetical protein
MAVANPLAGQVEKMIPKLVVVFRQLGESHALARVLHTSLSVGMVALVAALQAGARLVSQPPRLDQSRCR